MASEFDFMTREGIQRFLEQAPRKTDDQGEIGQIEVDDFLKLEAYKDALDLADVASTYKGTNRDAVDPVYNTFDWTVALDGVGLAVIHMNEPYEIGEVNVWATVYLDNEPYWDGYDPYECSLGQIAAIFNHLPEAERGVLLDLLSKNPEHELALRTAAGMAPSTSAARPS